MAFLVFFSTVSFSVDMHFCGDQLVDYSFFDDSADCGMNLLMPEGEACPMKAFMDCCTDQEFSQDGQDELALSFDKLDLDQQHFLQAFVLVFIGYDTGLPQQNIPFEHYDPPRITYDIQVLHETFLI